MDTYPVLQRIATQVEEQRGALFVILSLPCGFISGVMVSAQEYYTALGAIFAMSESLATVEERDRVRDSFLDRFDAPVPGTIYLRDAEAIGIGPLGRWQGLISEVAGFSLGQTPRRPA